ncbi:MAG: A24 family peptidase [archaeon]|nr:A24 family peptidase [archaeon]
MELILLRQIAILLASGVGAYVDFKTGYIYDWITIPLIIFGLAMNILEQEFSGIGLGILVFGIGYALYYTGKIGGGDVKLYTGIALALPFFNESVFIIQAVLLSALTSIIFLSVYYMIKYFRKGIDFQYNKKGIIRALGFLGVLIVYFFILSKTGFVTINYLLMFGLPLSFGVLFIAFEKGIRKEFFLKKIKLKDIEEDEIIAFEFMSEKEIKKFGKGFKGVFGEKEKKELEKKGIKEIFVYRDLPRFGIFIFLGVLIVFVFPEMGILLTGGF